jgi:hypothetical protein
MGDLIGIRVTAGVEIERERYNSWVGECTCEIKKFPQDNLIAGRFCP